MTLLGPQGLRPINLYNVLFKVISKVLVNILGPHLDTIIGPLQSSFITKKGTSGNAIIAQEIIHHMHNKKGKSDILLFKIETLIAFSEFMLYFLNE